ncbi:Uncharacterized protein Adt_31317 [Abeliophyllum distichum]|uniref:Uncharacterized protein n=1 Tax=Abeliophyllum distichum TaxID=126358 RepID=A0ABD1RDQ9_9LAMI
MIDHQDAPSQETSEEHHLLLFVTVQQFIALQDQVTIMMNILQRVTTPPPTVEILPAVEIFPAIEIPPSEITQTHEMMSSSCYSIPKNWENLLNEKVDEAIVRRKNRKRPITIKEDPFTEELMSVPLPLKFEEPTGDFDGTTNPIDHIRTF